MLLFGVFSSNSVLTEIEDGKHLVAAYVGRGKDNLDAGQ